MGNKCIKCNGINGKVLVQIWFENGKGYYRITSRHPKKCNKLCKKCYVAIMQQITICVENRIQTNPQDTSQIIFWK